MHKRNLASDRARARTILAQLRSPTEVESVDGALFYIQALTAIAAPLSPLLERRLGPWRQVEAARVREIRRELRAHVVDPR